MEKQKFKESAFIFYDCKWENIFLWSQPEQKIRGLMTVVGKKTKKRKK